MVVLCVFSGLRGLHLQPPFSYLALLLPRGQACFLITLLHQLQSQLLVYLGQFLFIKNRNTFLHTHTRRKHVVEFKAQTHKQAQIIPQQMHLDEYMLKNTHLHLFLMTPFKAVF